MLGKKIIHLLIDTSYLWKFGFNNPDFRKLLNFSKENLIKIVIPHIVWEERRTQLRENVYNKVRKIRRDFENLNKELPKNIILEGLTPPTLNIWTEDEIDGQSREAMRAFAKDNKIEIIPIAPDHADRAWKRYFDIDPPFNPDQARENRRKDIPDSWILEAAIDLKDRGSELIVLCGDGNLSDALGKNDICVFKTPQEILDEIERHLSPEPEVMVVETLQTMLGTREDMITATDNRLESALAMARETLRDLDAKVLGYIGYLGAPSKDQLLDLLWQSGISSATSMNIAEWLVINGIIKDTGNHYLVEDKEIGDLAASKIEPEIIKLLEK